jgi:DNA-binding transcriptional ArsR family regulator
MITIHMTPDDLVDIRFAYSPLIELVGSYETLVKPSHQLYFTRWIQDAKRTLNRIELPYLSEMIQGQGYIPDFLTPTPVTTRLTIEDEIERMLSVPNEIIRKNIEELIRHSGTSEIREMFLVYPRESLWCVIEEIRVYWQRVLAEHWPRLNTILEDDILYHGRRLALDGVNGLFATLHPVMTYQQQQILIDKPKSHGHRELSLNGEGLQLVPAVFASCSIMWQVSPEWRPMVIYGARGAGTWRQETQDPSQSLELALGAGRARVLQALMNPANTGELAIKLQLSAGGVSQHLDRLAQAGLVEPHRSGKRVYYHLTARGEQLLALFDATYAAIGVLPPADPTYSQHRPAESMPIEAAGD